MASRPGQSAQKGAAPVRLGAADEFNNKLFFRLFQAGTVYERQAQKEVKISAVQGALLGALSRDPVAGMPLAELVEYLAVSRQNLDGVLKRLEKVGYVERLEDASNRRSKIVRLTPTGLAAWEKIFARSLGFFRQAMRGIPSTAKVQFVETLTSITRGLKAVDLDAPPRVARVTRARS